MSSKILPQIRAEHAVLFPAPEDGDDLEITPPPMYWLEEEGVSEYRVVVSYTFLFSLRICDERVTNSVSLVLKSLSGK